MSESKHIRLSLEKSRGTRYPQTKLYRSKGATTSGVFAYGIAVHFPLTVAMYQPKKETSANKVASARKLITSVLAGVEATMPPAPTITNSTL